MDSIPEILPEISEIEDDELRQKVLACWELAIVECPFDSLNDVPWAPHYADLAGEQDLVDHVRDVTKMSITMVDELSNIRDFEVNRDFVVAGALLHDVSKVFEYDYTSETKIRELLVHPHFSIYVLEKADIPVEIQHIAISHTSRSGVKPKTIESVIVSEADGIAAHSIFWEATGDIKPYN